MRAKNGRLNSIEIDRLGGLAATHRWSKCINSTQRTQVQEDTGSYTRPHSHTFSVDSRWVIFLELANQLYSRETFKQMAMLFDTEHSSNSNDWDDISFIIAFRVDHPIETWRPHPKLDFEHFHDSRYTHASTQKNDRWAPDQRLTNILTTGREAVESSRMINREFHHLHSAVIPVRTEMKRFIVMYSTRHHWVMRLVTIP